MPQRLPTLGESPYKTILDGYLNTNHDATGLQTPLITFSTGVSRTAVPSGQTNLFSAYHTPTSTGVVQQVGFGIEMTGIATGGTSIFRIPLYVGAQTGGVTTPNGLDGINVVMQQNLADDAAYLNGVEITFNNLKRDDPLNPVDQNHFGMTIDAYGGFSIGPAALAIRTAAASSTWQRGLFIPQGSITAATGYAIDYQGLAGVQLFQVDNDANVILGNSLRFSGTHDEPPAGAAIYHNGGVALTIVSGTTDVRFFSNNHALELMRLTNAGLVLIGTADSTNMVAGDVRTNKSLWIGDGVTAPTARVGFAVIYVDTADGDLKVKFGDGVTKTLAVDT